jgi:hypothetical protein
VQEEPVSRSTSRHGDGGHKAADRLRPRRWQHAKREAEASQLGSVLGVGVPVGVDRARQRRQLHRASGLVLHRRSQAGGRLLHAREEDEVAQLLAVLRLELHKRDGSLYNAAAAIKQCTASQDSALRMADPQHDQVKR